jgi:hypothetical protein
MAYAYDGAAALDYFHCRYGYSRNLFRGPRSDLSGQYVAVLGGTETFGKFIAEPWPDLIARKTGRTVVNLGIVNAGLDAYLNDPAAIAVAAGAGLRIVQVLGAVNLSNRFYSVHPRRNDRFIAASAELLALYPEVDFTEFNFTRHLIQRLALLGSDRFEIVATELRAVWHRRMLRLLADTGGPTRLLWFAETLPPEDRRLRTGQGQPPLVDRRMLKLLEPLVEEVIEVVPRVWGGALEGKLFSPLDTPSALALPGPRAHEVVARRVIAAIERAEKPRHRKTAGQ